MIVLLEGPDGAGKSVLYKALYSKYHKNFIQCIDRMLPGQYLWWKKHIDSSEVYFIDRGFISEWVYRPIKEDRDANMTLEEIARLCTNNLLVVYCNNKMAYKNMLNRGDDYITTLIEHKAVCARYKEIVNTIDWFTNSLVFYYDYNKSEQHDLLFDTIDRFIDRFIDRIN